MNLTEPVQIFTNFLRAKQSEITRTGLSNRQTAQTETFNGTGAQTVYTLTYNSVAVLDVSVASVRLKPYIDYQIDLDNKKITFTTAPVSGTNNISISYFKGNTWIYPDKPRDTLSKTSYPRIAIVQLNENSSFMGMSEDDTQDNIVFQIDCLAFHEQMCTISGEQKEGQDVSEYLAREVIKTIKTNWRLYLYPKLFNPEIINNFSVPFDENKNIFRRIIEVRFETFNAGE